MATKRKPVLPNDLDLDDIQASPGAGRPQAPFHEIPSASVSTSSSSEDPSRSGLKDKAVNMSIYILPDDHRRLRRLAADEDTSIQALVLDGIDHVFRIRGQGPVQRWDTRRKARP